MVYRVAAFTFSPDCFHSVLTLELKERLYFLFHMTACHTTELDNPSVLQTSRLIPVFVTFDEVGKDFLLSYHAVTAK